MTNVFNLVSEETFAVQSDKIIRFLAAIAANSGGQLVPASWNDIQSIIRAGLADKVFSIGDRLTCQRAGADLVWDVIGIDRDTPADPQFSHSLTLQLHDCFPTALQFDAPEAFYYCESALTAGTYHFAVDGSDYQFTASEDIAAGSQLILGFTDNTPTTVTLSATVGGAVSEGSVAVTAGSQGTALDSGGMNDISRARYGSNSYKESAIRQWLGSSAAAGSVWTPQNHFDRPPSWAANTAGFLNGMDADFLAVVGSVEKVTATAGASDTTTDRFFLLSKSEIFGGSDGGVNEGPAYPYYSVYSDLAEAGTGEDVNRIRLRGGAAQAWWCRTRYSGTAHFVSNVYPNGTVYGTSAYGLAGVAPACIIV